MGVVTVVAFNQNAYADFKEDPEYFLSQLLEVLRGHAGTQGQTIMNGDGILHLKARYRSELYQDFLKKLEELEESHGNLIRPY
jgi:hypothetical protein